MLYNNKCMNKGNFPNELKTGKISPIYKKDNEDLLENYRPVSTLAIFRKIFEKIIFSPETARGSWLAVVSGVQSKVS